MRRFSIRIFTFLFALLAYQGINAQTVLFEESFEKSLGEFTIEGFNGDNNNIWQWDSFYLNAVADAYGKFSGAPVEVYLVSPEIKLTTNNKTSFGQNGQWFNDIQSEVAFCIREGGGAWEDIPVTLNNTGYNIINTGDINIPAKYDNKAVQFGFKYTSKQSNSSGILHIKYFVVNGDEGGSVPSDKQDPQISFDVTEVSCTMGEAFTAPVLNNPNNLAITYESSDNAVAAFDASGVMSIVGAGTATITARSAETDKYMAGEASYMLTVLDAEAGETVVFLEETFANSLGDFVQLSSNDVSNFWQWFFITQSAYAVADGNYVESHLISPEVKVGTNNKISFSYRAGDFADLNNEFKFCVREVAGQWHEFDIPVLNNEMIWTDVTIDIPAEFEKKNIQVAFKFAASAGTLCIKNVLLTGLKNNDVPVEKADPQISFEVGEVEAILGQPFEAPVLNNPNGVEVFYSSKNPDVASVSPATGKITLNGEGFTTITATSIANDNFKSAFVNYVLTVKAADASYIVFEENFETGLGEFTVEGYNGDDSYHIWEYSSGMAKADAYGKITGPITNYLVSPEITLATPGNIANFEYYSMYFADDILDEQMGFSVREIGGEWEDLEIPNCINSSENISSGDIVIPSAYAGKKVQVAFKYSSKSSISSGLWGIDNIVIKKSYVPAEKVDPALAFADTEVYFAIDGGDFTEPVLSNPNNVNVTYSSSDEAVATVDALTGEVTVVAEGSVTITAASEETEQYLAGSASYILTVTAPAVKEVIFSETFEEGLGEFTVEGYNGEAGNIWFHDIAFATADAYGKISEPVENYLVSPVITLGSESHVAHYGQFQSYFNKFAKETAFCIREVGGEWVKLTIPVYPKGDWAETGNIVVPDEFSGKDVQFGFMYTAQTSNSAGVWSISKFVVEKICNGTDPQISFGVSDFIAFVGQEFTAPELINPYDVKVMYSSSNPEVATVDVNTGEVKIESEGTTTITATSIANEAFVSTTASYILTVKQASAENVIFEADFETHFCGFAVEGFNGDEKPIWILKNSCARADAFLKVSKPTTNYLVSPIIRMSDSENIAEFNYKFMHDMNSSAAVEDEMGFCIREVGGEWQKLAIPNVSGDNEMVSSGEIVIPVEFAGKKVQVAFMYYAENGSTSGVWSIDDMVIRTSDVPTGIEGIYADDLKNGKVYNLQGMRVDKLGKGIYIVNGKKVVVK